jgi:hypothetical protein
MTPSKRRKVAVKNKFKKKRDKKEQEVLCMDGQMHSWAELDAIEANDASGSSPTKGFSA